MLFQYLTITCCDLLFLQMDLNILKIICHFARRENFIKFLKDCILLTCNLRLFLTKGKESSVLEISISTIKNYFQKRKRRKFSLEISTRLFLTKGRENLIWKFRPVSTQPFQKKKKKKRWWFCGAFLADGIDHPL